MPFRVSGIFGVLGVSGLQLGVSFQLVTVRGYTISCRTDLIIGLPKTERTTGAFEFSQHSLSENRLPEAAETASVTKAAVEERGSCGEA